MMSEKPSSFVEISAERRVKDDMKKARYNKFKTDKPEETKEYISKTTRNKKEGKSNTFSAKRHGTEEWDISEYDGPKSASSKAVHSKSKTLKASDAFKEFPELSVDKFIASVGGCGAGCAVGGKKGSRKKSSKKKGSRKKSSKKGGKSSKKKSSKKKSSKKKSSKKKSSRK